MNTTGETAEPAAVAVLVVKLGLEIAGLVAFIAGYFLGIQWLMIGGGILVVLDDVGAMAAGVLKPSFPVLLALVLAAIMTPWYTGVFWASAAFALINLPHTIRTLIAPRRFTEEALRRQVEISG